MSRFYISGENERDSKFKKGGRRDLRAHVRGWNLGIEVIAKVDENGHDCFEIYKTSGSNRSEASTLIKTVVDKKSAGPRNPKGQLK